MLVIKLKSNKDRKQESFSEFQRKIAIRFFSGAAVAILVVVFIYIFIWKERLGDLIVMSLEFFTGMNHEEAFMIYHQQIRGYKEVFFVVSVILIFFVLMLLLFSWLAKYFKEVNSGIDALLKEDEKHIHLSKEMYPFEYKLNSVKRTLEKQKQDTAKAEERKDELVMYLAHDIRTPLTSVIGYLSLLDENKNMTEKERRVNVQVALDKAYRLEKMIHEFFEITKYHSKQIKLNCDFIDLYYMLVQLCDEFHPILALHNHSVILEFDQSITIFADSNKLARVFSNILRNAASYSYLDTDIVVQANKTLGFVEITIQNKGPNIPDEKLDSLFDKFYRLDKARMSDSGGTGLGLAIVKEIILLHGGSIEATSVNDTITFKIKLPTD